MLVGKWKICKVESVPDLQVDDDLYISEPTRGSFVLSGPVGWETSTDFVVGADGVLKGSAQRRRATGHPPPAPLPLRLKVRADGKLDACLGGACKLDGEAKDTGHEGPGFTGSWAGEGGGVRA